MAAEGVEVVERVHAGMEHVGVVRHVVDGVEQRVAVVVVDRAVVEFQMLDVDHDVLLRADRCENLVAAIEDRPGAQVSADNHGVVTNSAIKQRFAEIGVQRVIALETMQLDMAASGRRQDVVERVPEPDVATEFEIFDILRKRV